MILTTIFVLDIYIACVSFSHNVAPKDKYVAICSTIAETDKPEAELEPALKLLGPIQERFVDVCDMYEPTNNCEVDKCFISNSYDSTSHFDSACDNILALYRKITGNDIKFKKDEVTTEGGNDDDDGAADTAGKLEE